MKNPTLVKRKLMITTGLGITLIEGETILSNAEILKLFDKKQYGIFVGQGRHRKRIDL